MHQLPGSWKIARQILLKIRDEEKKQTKAKEPKKKAKPRKRKESKKEQEERKKKEEEEKRKKEELEKKIAQVKRKYLSLLDVEAKINATWMWNNPEKV